MSRREASSEKHSSGPRTLFVPIEAKFLPYIEAAIMRLGYIYPTVEFVSSARGIEAATSGTLEDVAIEDVAIKREILHAVYREAILERTLPLRTRFIDSLLTS